jgi:hypothetical protein
MFGRTKPLWTGSSLQACREFSEKAGDVPCGILAFICRTIQVLLIVFLQ